MSMMREDRIIADFLEVLQTLPESGITFNLTPGLFHTYFVLDFGYDGKKVSLAGRGVMRAINTRTAGQAFRNSGISYGSGVSNIIKDIETDKRADFRLIDKASKATLARCMVLKYTSKVGQVRSYRRD